MNHELAHALVNWSDHDEADYFKEITEETIDSKTRWHVHYSQVFKDTRDNTFWKLNWKRGATEYQDDDDEVNFCQVEPQEVTIIKYVQMVKKD